MTPSVEIRLNREGRSKYCMIQYCTVPKVETRASRSGFIYGLRVQLDLEGKAEAF